MTREEDQRFLDIKPTYAVYARSTRIFSCRGRHLVPLRRLFDNGNVPQLTDHAPSSLVPPQRLLFGNARSPVTTQLTFLACPVYQAAEGFTHWRQDLGRLAPLTFEHRRHLFVPTGSRWTAYFNNYPLGTNVWSVLPSLVHYLGC